MILVQKMMARKIISVGEDCLNMCKDVVVESSLMQSQVENDLHDDVELQSEHALDVLVDEHGNVELPFQSIVESIVAYVEEGKSIVDRVSSEFTFRLSPSSFFHLNC